jgi:hypothetical protein
MSGADEMVWCGVGSKGREDTRVYGRGKPENMEAVLFLMYFVGERAGR